MVGKKQHSQCLKVFAGNPTDLRTSHKLQKQCILGPEAVRQSIAGCVEWYGCLPQHARDVILNVATAFDEAPAALAQVSTEGRQNHSNPVWTSAHGHCKDGAHPICENPTILDIEAFDCNCYEELKQKTPKEILAFVCKGPLVCCSWKNVHCSADHLQADQAIHEMLEDEDTEETQRTLLQRRGESGKKMHGLEDAISRKPNGRAGCTR